MLGAGLLLVAAGAALTSGPDAFEVADASAARLTPVASSPAPVRSTPPPASTRAEPAPPVALGVDALALAASVEPVLVDPDGALALPADPGVLGWWAMSAPPGAPTGTTLIAAHVDAPSHGPGPMAALARAPMGTVLTVTDAAGASYSFTLTERRSLDKSELPSDLFAAQGPARLVLITCGGPFDRATGHYRDNVVLFASPS